MKKLMLTFFAASISFAIGAQTNPYEVFGYESKVNCTTPTERFFELKNADGKSKIKTLAFDFANRSIYLFDDENCLLKTISLDDGRLLRWLSVDPKAQKYAGFSPYNFVADNPLNNIDPDGREIKPLTSSDNSTLQSTFNQYSSLFSYTTFPTQQNVGNATGQNGSFNVFTTRTTQNTFQRRLNASNLTPQQRQEATAIFRVLSSTDVIEIGVITSASNTATTPNPPTPTNNVEIRGTTNPNALALFNTPNKTDQLIQSNILAQPVSGSTAGGATYGYYPQPQGQATPAPRGNGGTFVGAVLINNAPQSSFTTGQANTISPTQAVTETIQNIFNLGIVR